MWKSVLRKLVLRIGLAAAIMSARTTVAASLPAPSIHRTSPLPVVIITDMGGDPDDAWAVTHLAFSPTIEIRGMISAFVPPYKDSSKYTRGNVVSLLKHLPRVGRFPVVAGVNGPLESSGGDSEEGAELIRRLAAGLPAERSQNRRLNVVIIGPATDVAIALTKYPWLENRVKITAMAFEKWPYGGDRWNVKADPVAWQILLKSRVPMTIGSGSVAIGDLSLSDEEARALTTAPYLLTLFTDWVDASPSRNQGVTGDPKKWPLWDEIAAADLLGFAEHATVPRPCLNALTTAFYACPNPGPAINWITHVDKLGLWSDFKSKLAANLMPAAQ